MFQFFKLKNQHKISEEIWLKIIFFCMIELILSESVYKKNHDLGPVFKILIWSILVQSKVDWIRNPASYVAELASFAFLLQVYLCSPNWDQPCRGWIGYSTDMMCHILKKKDRIEKGQTWRVYHSCIPFWRAREAGPPAYHEPCLPWQPKGKIFIIIVPGEYDIGWKRGR